MKITDKLQKAAEEKRDYWSFEFFPPKTDAGVTNLYDRMERMQVPTHRTLPQT